MIINDFIPSNGLYLKLNSINEGKNENEFDDSSINFGDALKSKLNEINTKQLEAEKTTENFIKGEDVDIHQVMIQTEEAKLSLELAVQVRNKMLEAYQEINRMQV